MTYSVDGQTIALLHFDGTDASTTITDEISANVWTAAGTAQIDVDQYKFPTIGSSLLLDGNSDYLSCPDNAKWVFAGDFTIDFWVRFAAFPTDGVSMYLYSQYASSSELVVSYVRNTSGTYYFRFVVVTGGVTTIYIDKALSSLAVDTWYHLAVVRSGNNFMMFRDGTQVGTTTVDDSAIPNIAAALEIGRTSTGSYFNGWIAEYRISTCARWTSNFYPDSFSVIPLTYKPRDTRLTFKER